MDECEWTLLYRSLLKAFESLRHMLEAIRLLAMHSITDESSHAISDQRGISKALSLIVSRSRMEIFYLYGPATFIAVPTYSFIDSPI